MFTTLTYAIWSTISCIQINSLIYTSLNSFYSPTIANDKLFQIALNQALSVANGNALSGSRHKTDRQRLACSCEPDRLARHFPAHSLSERAGQDTIANKNAHSNEAINLMAWIKIRIKTERFHMKRWKPENWRQIYIIKVVHQTVAIRLN